MQRNHRARPYGLCAHLTILFCAALATACGRSDGFVGSENSIPSATNPAPAKDDEQNSAVQQGHRSDSNNNDQDNADENSEPTHTVISESEYDLSHADDVDYIDVTLLLLPDGTFEKELLLNISKKACNYKNKTLILVIDDRWSGNKKPLKLFLKILREQNCSPAVVQLKNKKPKVPPVDKKDIPIKEPIIENPKNPKNDLPNPPKDPKNKDEVDKKLPTTNLDLIDFESELEFLPEE